MSFPNNAKSQLRPVLIVSQSACLASLQKFLKGKSDE